MYTLKQLGSIVATLASLASSICTFCFAVLFCMVAMLLINNACALINTGLAPVVP